MTARAVTEAARPLALAGIALGIAAAFLALLGYAPGPALAALGVGAFGSSAAWTATLLKTTPLLLTGLAVLLAFRVGVWNIGAEGQLYMGALAATFVATRGMPDAPSVILLPAVVAAGMLGGAVFGALAGGLRATRGVSEVISTILLNFVAIQLVALAIHGPLQESAGAYPQSDVFPLSARLPAVGRLHLGVAAGLAIALAVQWLLFRTPTGFRFRAVGLSAQAARFAGISPSAQALLAITVAGALAGLAGAFEVSGVTGRLYEGLSPGHGYTAIAVALLARLHPVGAIGAAFFFGALEAGAGAMQRQAAVPSVVTQMVQGLVVLLCVGFAFARATAPPADSESRGEA